MRVVLVSAAPSGSQGSMSIHAELVKDSLAALPLDCEIQTVHLLHRVPAGPIHRMASIAAARWRSQRVQADVLHWLDGSHAYLAGRFDWSRALVTVHDLIPALQAAGRFPGVAPPGWAARQLIASSLRVLQQAAAVCTVSESTAHDLHSLTGRQADAVVTLCLRPLPTPIHTIDSAVDPAILHVGHNGFYKNRTAVIEVFAGLALRFPRLQLWLAGAPASPSLQQLIEGYGLTRRVRWIASPSDTQLVQLYRRASLLLFPSLYEGFGWPPLEAMAQGCPVVCSSAGALPEVVGIAALRCAPHDKRALINACERLLSQPELRTQLVAAGIANLQRFSSRRMGEQLFSLYQRIAAVASVRPSTG